MVWWYIMILWWQFIFTAYIQNILVFGMFFDLTVTFVYLCVPSFFSSSFLSAMKLFSCSFLQNDKWIHLKAACSHYQQRFRSTLAPLPLSVPQSVTLDLSFLTPVLGFCRHCPNLIVMDWLHSGFKNQPDITRQALSHHLLRSASVDVRV